MTNNKFYITTTLPYVNSEPHIGFALEIVRADVLARWHRLKGEAVFFNTGVDEHGLKIFRKAEELGITPQAYCDQMAAKFADLKSGLNLSYDNFIRTTDEHHVAAAQEFWRRCLANGDIYKKTYQVKYCVGCELEKTDSELVNDRCPDHPNTELELIDEENYFFRFSRYAEALLKMYAEHPDFVLPASRQNEITKFIERGLSDFSISRLKEKMPWGVAVPDDENQVMYVWFDALVNYISCLGWPDNEAQFATFWPGLQICGKDNLRQQTAMWQAMLMSAQLPTSQQVLVNGFITADGQKMSKSLGNVVNPLALAEQYGTDVVRYYLLAHVNPFEDSDFTEEKFRLAYTADLANGLGNLLSRVSNLYEKNQLSLVLPDEKNNPLLPRAEQLLSQGLFSELMKELWDLLKKADEKLSADRPWKLTEAVEVQAAIEPIALDLVAVARILQVLMPDTAAKVLAVLSTGQIKKAEPLFARLS